MANFPGSIITKTDISGRQFIDGMFNGASGLVMSQIREFTGLNTPAIQNWINRGWLSRPTGKRYNENQVARILIINLLRETMSLENVTKLLFYVNGVAGDESDDIISETELYGYICDIIFKDGVNYDIDGVISETVKNFSERRPGDVERLKKALKIVYLNYKAGLCIQASEKMLGSLQSCDSV